MCKVCICSQFDNKELLCNEDADYDMVSDFINLDRTVIYTTNKEEIHPTKSTNTITTIKPSPGILFRLPAESLVSSPGATL